jgi:hypothetical protein
VKGETVLRIVEAVAPLGQQTVFWLHVTVGVPCVFTFGLRSPLLRRSLRSSASSFLSHLSASSLSGWRSRRTSYSRVHTNGGFEETIEAAKAAWTRIKKNTALAFEDWLCICGVLVIGRAAKRRGLKLGGEGRRTLLVQAAACHRPNEIMPLGAARSVAEFCDLRLRETVVIPGAKACPGRLPFAGGADISAATPSIAVSRIRNNGE